MKLNLLMTTILAASALHVVELEPVTLVYSVPWSDPSATRPVSSPLTRSAKSLLNTFPFNQPGIHFSQHK